MLLLDLKVLDNAVELMQMRALCTMSTEQAGTCSREEDTKRPLQLLWKVFVYVSSRAKYCSDGFFAFVLGKHLSNRLSSLRSS